MIGSTFRAVGQATFFTKRVFSSPEHEVLRVSYCDSDASIVQCASSTFWLVYALEATSSVPLS